MDNQPLPTGHHAFSLHSHGIPNRYEVQISFTPLNNAKTHPTFNRDANPFTHAFVLEADYSEQSDQQEYRNYYEKKCRAAEQEGQTEKQLYVPRPCKRHGFCAACTVQYSDYMTHIELPSHRQKLESSPFNHRIARLCTQVQKMAREEEKRRARLATLASKKKKARARVRVRARQAKTKPIEKQIVPEEIQVKTVIKEEEQLPVAHTWEDYLDL